MSVLTLSVPASFALTIFAFKGKHDLEMWFLSGRMMPLSLLPFPFT
jgi:ABC-type glycerol-3-phosphate transport system permease component